MVKSNKKYAFHSRRKSNKKKHTARRSGTKSTRIRGTQASDPQAIIDSITSSLAVLEMRMDKLVSSVRHIKQRPRKSMLVKKRRESLLSKKKALAVERASLKKQLEAEIEEENMSKMAASEQSKTEPQLVLGSSSSSSSSSSASPRQATTDRMSMFKMISNPNSDDDDDSFATATSNLSYTAHKVLDSSPSRSVSYSLHQMDDSTSLVTSKSVTNKSLVTDTNQADRSSPKSIKSTGGSAGSSFEHAKTISIEHIPTRAKPQSLPQVKSTGDGEGGNNLKPIQEILDKITLSQSIKTSKKTSKSVSEFSQSISTMREPSMRDEHSLSLSS